MSDGNESDDRLTDELATEADVIAAVRRRTLRWGLVSVVFLGLTVWMMGGLAGVGIGGAMLVGALFRLVQAWRNPLDHRHVIEPNPLKQVLAADGLPEPRDGSVRTPSERRLAAQELIDRLRWEAEGFWATRAGRVLLKTGGWLGVVLWGILGVIMLAVGEPDFLSTGVCAVAAGLFFMVDRYGRRQEADRQRALELLEDELLRLDHPGPEAATLPPPGRRPVSAAPTPGSSPRER